MVSKLTRILIAWRFLFTSCYSHMNGLSKKAGLVDGIHLVGRRARLLR